MSHDFRLEAYPESESSIAQYLNPLHSEDPKVSLHQINEIVETAEKGLDLWAEDTDQYEVRGETTATEKDMEEEFRTNYRFVVHDGSAWIDEQKESLNHENIVGSGQIGFNSATRGERREYAIARYKNRNDGIQYEDLVDIQETLRMALESEMSDVTEV